MPKVQKRGSRKPNWTKEEEDALLDAIEPQYTTLFGEMSHLVSQDTRDGIWRVIHKKVIASNLYNVKRDLKSIKKKWKDMKFRTKGKVAKLLKEHGVFNFEGGEDDFMVMLEDKMGPSIQLSEIRLARLIGKNTLIRFGDADTPEVTFGSAMLSESEMSNGLSMPVPAKRTFSRSTNQVLEPETILIEVNETYDNKDCSAGSRLPTLSNGFSALKNGDATARRAERRHRLGQVTNALHVPSDKNRLTVETKLLAAVSSMKDELAGVRREVAALKDCLAELVTLKKIQLGIGSYPQMSND